MLMESAETWCLMDLPEEEARLKLGCVFSKPYFPSHPTIVSTLACLFADFPLIDSHYAFFGPSL